MPRKPTLSRVAYEAAVLAGHVARHSDSPRSKVEDYLGRHLSDPCLGELASAWIEGWECAELEVREGRRGRYMRGMGMSERRSESGGADAP